MTTQDMVNRPAHYNNGDIECIDAIRSALGDEGFRAFCKGTAIRYLWRAGLKFDGPEDLRKATWYTRMASGDDPRRSVETESCAAVLIHPLRSDIPCNLPQGHRGWHVQYKSLGGQVTWPDADDPKGGEPHSVPGEEGRLTGPLVDDTVYGRCESERDRRPCILPEGHEECHSALTNPITLDALQWPIEDEFRCEAVCTFAGERCAMRQGHVGGRHEGPNTVWTALPEPPGRCDAKHADYRCQKDRGHEGPHFQRDSQLETFEWSTGEAPDGRCESTDDDLRCRKDQGHPECHFSLDPRGTIAEWPIEDEFRCKAIRGAIEERCAMRQGHKGPLHEGLLVAWPLHEGPHSKRSTLEAPEALDDPNHGQ